jgi:putative hemolysin
MEEHFSASPGSYERFMEMQKPFQKEIPSILKGVMGKLINMPELEKLYRQVHSQLDLAPFWDRLLHSLGITYRVSDEDINRIPRRGPLVVVANHPFGAIEGLVLGSVLRSVRADAKILANSILQPIAELHDLFICVDAFRGPGAAHYNFQPLRTAFRWLENGGVLAAFPAGEVTHLRLGRAEITDPDWKNTVTQMARRLKLPVLPVYFCGTNSLMFQMMGLVHPKVRTALLAREMLNKRNHTIEVRIGKLIPSAAPRHAQPGHIARRFKVWTTCLLSFPILSPIQKVSLYYYATTSDWGQRFCPLISTRILETAWMP